MEGEGAATGLWGPEPALMDSGESPNAENADGRSALMLAAAAGDLSAVETLVMAGALLDAQDHYGMTALMNAVVMRRLEVTQLLLDAGADPNTREVGGRTALMFAAATDHAEIVESLIVAGTELDATCGPKWRTPLMIAAEGAREKALRMLLAHGADPSIRDIDGKTAAHLARTKRMVRLLRKYDRTKERSSFLGGLLRGRLHRSGSSNVKSTRRLGAGSCRTLELEPAAADVALGIELADVRSLCEAMQESQFPCDRIYERLADVSARLQSTAHVMRKSDDVNDEYLHALSSFYALLATWSRKHAVTRLLSSRAIMKSCFDLHSQLDELEEKLLSANQFEAKSSWQQQWEIDCETHSTLLMEFIAQTQALQDNYMTNNDEESRVEALTLLSFECERRRAKYSTQQLYLMHKYAQSVTRRFHTLVVSAPQWFIPAYDVEFAQDESRYERVGFWCDKPVLVKTLSKHDDQQRFAKDIEAWMALQHPHVLQLYGACHVGEHPFVVLEAAVSTSSLAEYLRRQRVDTKQQLDLEHFQLLWRTLRQVAQAIEYLHERNIAHGQLHRSSSIVVDGTGSVKLHMGLDNVPPEGSGSVSRFSRASSISSSERRLLDAGDAFASDIYMLGRLILNALTLSDWPRELDLRDGETLPKRPASMTNAHWSLIERMCVTNASQRCNASSALQQIQQFADL